MLFERLVHALSIPTRTGGDEAPFVDFGEFLAAAFPGMHAALELERVNGHTRMYRWPGTRPELVPDLFVSHFDVVPEGDAGAWSRSPWGERAGGRVYGRGALDVKSGVMAMLEAAEEFVGRGWRPERDLWMVLGHDEETGGYRGAAAAAALFRGRGIRFRCVYDEGGAIVANPLGGGEVAAVGVAEKGWVDVKVTARGAGGHASLSAAFNPLVASAQGVARMPGVMLPPAIPAPALELVAALSAGRPLQVGAIRLAAALAPRMLHRALLRVPDVRTQVATLVTATRFEAGHAPNAVPDRAELVLNCRIAPGSSRADVVAWIARYFPGDTFEITSEGGSEPSPTVDAQGEEFARLRNVIEGLGLASRTVPMVFTGITDSRHYVDLAGAVLRFLPLRLTPANRSGIHGVDEHIEEGNYLEIIQFYKALFERCGMT